MWDERKGDERKMDDCLWQWLSKGKDRGHILNIKYSRKGALVKQVQKRFNPDEIRATEISLGRLGRQRR